jgi:hypothetical protein
MPVCVASASLHAQQAPGGNFVAFPQVIVAMQKIFTLSRAKLLRCTIISLRPGLQA